MKKYIFSGAALLMGVLASPGYSATIILNFDANLNNNTNGIPCSTTVTPFFCLSVGGQGAPLSPTGNPPQFATTLVAGPGGNAMANIIFNEVTITGDSAINGGAATVFTFSSNGTAFSYNLNTSTLANTGTITSGALAGTAVNITDLSPTVFASTGGGFDPVYFANGTVNVPQSLATALGIVGSYTAFLGSDAGSGVGGGCNYPEGTRNPQTTGPAAGPLAGGCVAGFGPNNADLNAESQYFEVVITTTTTSTPEPQTSLLLGFALVAVGSLARKRRQKI